MSTAVLYTDEQFEAFLRSITPPEEDRRQYTAAPARGFRWFRSANVIPLEQYRRRHEPSEPDKAA